MMTNKLGRLALILIIIVAALFAVRKWLYAFIKLEHMRVPYVVLFSTLLLFGLWAMSERLKSSLAGSIMLGAIVGQIAATLSLTCANFFIPNGVERNFTTFAREGFLSSLLNDVMVAFILGGWLLGAIVFWLYRSLERASF
jgi:Na+/H+-dicarboxylate symporter